MKTLLFVPLINGKVIWSGILLENLEAAFTHYEFLSKKKRMEFTVDTRGPQRKSSILRRCDLLKRVLELNGIF